MTDPMLDKADDALTADATADEFRKEPSARVGTADVATRRLRPLAALAAIVAVVLGVGLGIDAVSHAGRAYDGVTVGGVDVSGLDVNQIVEKVSEVYEPIVHAKPVRAYASQEAMEGQYENVDVDDFATVEDEYDATYVWTADAESLDAHIDYEAAAKQAVDLGRSSPMERLGIMTEGKDVTLSVDCDDELVDEFATQMDYTLGYRYEDCTVEMDGDEPYVVEGHDGDMVDREWLEQKVSSLLMQDSDESRDFVAETEYHPLHIGYDEAEACAQRIKEAIAAGADITCGDETWHADAYAIARWIGTEVVDHDDGTSRLRPVIEASRARNSILIHTMPGLQRGDEKVRIDENKGKVYVSVDAQGQMPDVDAAIASLDAALFGDDGFGEPSLDDGCAKAEAGMVDIPPEMSFDEAVEKGVIAPISRFTTEYTAGAVERNNNIHLAADLVDMSIAKGSGGTWSFNDIAGNCTEERGFQSAKAIAGNETVDEIGGGICQVATTVFNAAYLAGFTILERTNHSLYMPSYPDGRDSAISYPELDLVWRNDSYSDCILVMGYDDTSVTATIYGIDPGYTVETETGEWQPGEKFDTVYRADPDVAPGVEYVETEGLDGMSIQVQRTVTDLDGKVIREDEFSSTYSPQDKVIVHGADQ